MSEQTKDEVRTAVRDQYAKVARSSGRSDCAPGCCGPNATASLELGYSAEDLAAVPEGANMGLGCGNPQAIAALRPGETVLDSAPAAASIASSQPSKSARRGT